MSKAKRSDAPKASMSGPAEEVINCGSLSFRTRGLTPKEALLARLVARTVNAHIRQGADPQMMDAKADFFQQVFAIAWRSSMGKLACMNERQLQDIAFKKFLTVVGKYTNPASASHVRASAHVSVVYCQEDVDDDGESEAGLVPWHSVLGGTRELVETVITRERLQQRIAQITGERAKQVFDLLSRGLEAEEIAKELGITATRVRQIHAGFKALQDE